MSKAYPCIYCTDDLKCTKYTDDESTSFCILGPCHDARPSRADQIRYKNDEQLAEMLSRFSHCAECPVRADSLCMFFVSSESCAAHWLEWLKKEADNG